MPEIDMKAPVQHQTLDEESAGPIAELPIAPTQSGFGSQPGLERPQPQVTRVGRFSVTRKLGAGAMGTVYEGWDEELQRLVALKFLRSVVDNPAGQHRFLREAQGLAQLSHPNVTPVYDVGRHEGCVWMAMEHVCGRTLGEWASAEPRDHKQIVRNWIDAGRGLAAIHAAGLVHRDVKPANVLLGDDGRVRIIDFGLVKAIDSPEDASESSRAPTIEAELCESVTAQDAFVGTPAYAAPEQIERRWVDARSDQFSLCVALWEALVGERPPREERGRNELVRLPQGKHMPARLHRALSRGLAREPRQRFGDVSALLAALEPRQRRWVVPIATACVSAVIAAAVGVSFASPSEGVIPVDLCASASEEIDAAWTLERRWAVENRLPAGLVGPTQELLDDWAHSWSDAALSNCEDIHSRQLAAGIPDHRGICLERRLEGFKAFMFAVEGGRVASAQVLTEWLGTLDDPSECLDESVSARTYEPVRAEHVEEVAELRQRLIDVGVSSPEVAISARARVAERVLERALELDAEALVGEASLLVGRLRMKRRDIEAARVALGRAVDIGMAASDLELAANAWSSLTWIESAVVFDVQGAQWTRARQAALFADVEAPPRRRARLLWDRALILDLDERHKQAVEVLREAISLYASVGLTAAWEQAATTRMLGNQLVILSHEEEALALFSRARDLELHLGERSESSRAGSISMDVVDENIALVASGRAQEARERLERGLELARSEYGPRSELVVRLHVVLAAACEELGDVEGVRYHAQRADEVSLVAVGSMDLRRVDVLSAVGVVALEDGRPSAAVAAFRQALSIARRYKAHDSLPVSLAERNLAVGLHAAGEDASAIRLAEHALEQLESLLPDDDPKLSPALVTLGEISLARGDTDKACAHLVRAEQLLEGSGSDELSAVRKLLERCSD